MRTDAGYSLMEVLVMLAITALLSATVLESVRAAASNGLRIERASRQASQPFVSLSAARLAVEGTRADYRDSENAFSGDRTGFSALTASPIVADRAALEPYRLYVEEGDGETVLVYEDTSGRFEVGRWRGDRAGFRYLGDVPQAIGDMRTALGRPRPKVWSETWPLEAITGDVGVTMHYIPSPVAVELVVSAPDRADERVVFQLPAGGGPPIRADDLF